MIERMGRARDVEKCLLNEIVDVGGGNARMLDEATDRLTMGVEQKPEGAPITRFEQVE